MNRNNLNNIKYIGYCMSSLPPEGELIDYDDFVNFAKFKLCESRNVLMKSPIWDEYTPEEILIEYFAIAFSTNEEFKKSFENKYLSDDIYNWFDKMESDNQKELENLASESEDGFNFSPEGEINE